MRDGSYTLEIHTIDASDGETKGCGKYVVYPKHTAAMEEIGLDRRDAVFFHALAIGFKAGLDAGIERKNIRVWAEHRHGCERLKLEMEFDDPINYCY